MLLGGKEGTGAGVGMVEALELNHGEGKAPRLGPTQLTLGSLCSVPSSAEAFRRSRAPQERHFLRTALSAHLLCAQPELPLINCALLPRAGFDAGLPKRAQHTQEMSLMSE